MTYITAYNSIISSEFNLNLPSRTNAKTMKKLLVPLLCLLSSFAAHADSTLWLEESNGNKREFCLSDQPKVTFADREILLSTDNSTIYLRLDPSVKFYFAVNGVNVINSDSKVKSNGTYRFVDGGVEVDLQQSDVPVYLYSIGGLRIYSTSTDNTGKAFLPTDNLDKGIYIVYSRGFQFKIATK